jgi:hypothetical protein
MRSKKLSNAELLKKQLDKLSRLKDDNVASGVETIDEETSGVPVMEIRKEPIKKPKGRPKDALITTTTLLTR